MASTSETQSSTFRDMDHLSQADVALEKAGSNERITANIPDSFYIEAIGVVNENGGVGPPYNSPVPASSSGAGILQRVDSSVRATNSPA